MRKRENGPEKVILYERGNEILKCAAPGYCGGSVSRFKTGLVKLRDNSPLTDIRRTRQVCILWHPSYDGYGVWEFLKGCATKCSHDLVLSCAFPFATAGDSRVRWSEDKFFAPGMQEKNSEGMLTLNKILLSVLIQRKTVNMSGGELILHLQITVE